MRKSVKEPANLDQSLFRTFLNREEQCKVACRVIWSVTILTDCLIRQVC